MSAIQFKIYFVSSSAAEETAKRADDGVALGAGLCHGGGSPKNWPGNVGVGAAGRGSKVGRSTSGEAAPGTIAKTNPSNSSRVDEPLCEGKRNKEKEKGRDKSMHDAK